MTDARQPSTRDERLKAALRDNLRRRKAQARNRAETDANASGPASQPEGKPADER